MWDLEVRPKKLKKWAIIVAAIFAIGHIAAGLVLRHGNTGVNFRVSDQFALAAIGIVEAGMILMLTRPRLRVGPQGVVVRNVFSENTFGWDDIVTISFPMGAKWARVELPNDEYAGAMALQASDGQYAVDSMNTIRGLVEKYKVHMTTNDVRDVGATT